MAEMPWKETCAMDQRRQFVLHALEPKANIAALCREFEISRKTGYKLLARFREEGVQGIEERSRRPAKSTEVSDKVIEAILREKALRPRRGPKKIHQVLVRRGVTMPSVRTVARVLDRAGQVRKRRKRSEVTVTSPREVIPASSVVNGIWSVDFKGWWKTLDGRRAEPLTVRDECSRFVIAAELLDSTGTVAVKQAFERIFAEYRVPQAIRVDNGSPFGCTRARGGLSRLSAWWVALGIRVIFGRPAHPQDNGGHERMHRDIALDVQSSPATDLVRQQIELDIWRQEFNHNRPHEALGMKTPAEFFRPSTRKFGRCRIPFYSPGWFVRRVGRGRVVVRDVIIRVGDGFDGYSVGFEPTSLSEARLWFYEVDLGPISLLPRSPGYDRKALRNRLRSLTRPVTSTVEPLSPYP